MTTATIVENQSPVMTVVLNSSSVDFWNVLFQCLDVVLKTTSAALQGWTFWPNLLNALLVSSKASFVGPFFCVNFTRLLCFVGVYDFLLKVD